MKGQVFAAIHKQLKYFAGRQIRNVGTPAGNLATASPISDLNPVFVASNAIIVAKSLDKETEIPVGNGGAQISSFESLKKFLRHVLFSSCNLPGQVLIIPLYLQMSQFFKGYRTTALPADAIIASIRIPMTSEKGEHFQAFKQAKRKDDDIAIVNAALRVSLSNKHVVESADLVYGGMAPTTVAAKTASAYLVGKSLVDPATLEGTMNALEQDFDLRFGVPGGMATYRKSLALGFFYRFYHEVLSKLEVKVADLDEEVIAEIERSISMGKEDREATVAYQQNILGKAAPHVAALKQTTGEAQYTDDIPGR